MPTRIAVVVARWEEPDSGQVGKRDQAVRNAISTLVECSDQVDVKALSFDNPGHAHAFADGIGNAIVEKLNEFGELSREGDA